MMNLTAWTSKCVMQLDKGFLKLAVQNLTNSLQCCMHSIARPCCLQQLTVLVCKEPVTEPRGVCLLEKPNIAENEMVLVHLCFGAT
eukprot:2020609-Rhodomonas_salina.4